MTYPERLHNLLDEHSTTNDKETIHFYIFTFATSGKETVSNCHFLFSIFVEVKKISLEETRRREDSTP